MLCFTDWRDSLNDIEPLAKSILDFWVGEIDDAGLASPEKRQRWFKKDPEFDMSVKRIYGSYLETAFMGAFDRWTTTTAGTTAVIILMDQFPRNIYRDLPKAFHWDKKALSLALKAIDERQHLKASVTYANFMLLPTMHSEELAVQELGVNAYKEILTHQTSDAAKEMVQASLDYAIRHLEIIKKYGRFPHRNQILGRESTDEELAFLKEPGSSF